VPASTARRRAWRFLGRIVVRQRLTVALAIASGLSWQAAAIAAPVIAGHALDRGILQRDGHALAVYGLAILALGLLEAVAGGFRHIFAIRNRSRADAAVRDAIFTHALGLDAPFPARVGPGELMSRASNDAELVARLLDAIGHTVGYLLTVLGVAIVLLFIDLPLALVVLVPLPILAFGFWRYSTRYAQRTKLLQEQLAASTTIVEETVSGIRVVKGLGAGGPLSDRFRRSSNEIVDRALAVARVDAIFLPVLELLPLLELLAVLWLGGRRVIAGDLSYGSFVAFNLYVVMLVWPLRVLGQRVGTMQNALAAAERITEVLAARPQVVEQRHGARRLPRGGVQVELERVIFGYDPAEPVLNGLELKIEPGESVALVGETGSGKSTLAALLTRFYDVQGGAVRLNGVDVRDLKLAEVRHAVGIVFDDTFLFTDTVRANIAFATPTADLETVERASQLAGAHDFVERLPDGYDTMLGERGFSLSGGQRQRIAIARAILADPAVLVLDDATSAVDATKEHEIRAALATVMQGRTTLVIAHRPATIALAGRVAVLAGGVIVEQGTHAQLLADSPRYRDLLALEKVA
jgi:ATP-binding cassette subfamily B protein